VTPNQVKLFSRFPHLQAAKNYITSTIQHVATGSRQVTDDTFKLRRATCDSCPHRDTVTDTCQLCKCPLHRTILGDKLRRASSTCPAGKWGKV
jgi:hypothetical protein